MKVMLNCFQDFEFNFFSRSVNVFSSLALLFSVYVLIILNIDSSLIFSGEMQVNCVFSDAILTFSFSFFKKKK